jgi:deoxyribodipyrimidine photo-lyase
LRTLVWFRGKDLRLADHAPLREAARQGEVLPLFVVDPYFFTPERARELPHRMQFLIESIQALERNLADRGSKLIVVHGKSTDVIPRLAEQWKVDRVVAHRWVEPFGRERDRRIASALHVPFELHEGETLLPPGTLRTGDGRPYAVFTPFARAFAEAYLVDKPLAAPATLPPLPLGIEGGAPLPTLETLGIVPNPQLRKGGEKAARDRLRAFVKDGLRHYHDRRNALDGDGTSRLSQDLKFGTVSIRTVAAAVASAGDGTAGARAFVNELIWREFAYSTLWDRPSLLQEPFRPEFAAFPWQTSGPAWDAWTAGRTGYPVVDAAARQLLGEGFVHNRARMIAASFLAKHLLIDYRRGEAHYMKYLTDGDWAQNNAGWQWSAGCGCDAQPYFRVFHPTLQGKKFDPEGNYVRRWVPELAALPAVHVHEPWKAPAEVLRKANVVLDETYPRPIVDHAEARQRFLAIANAVVAKRR